MDVLGKLWKPTSMGTTLLVCTQPSAHCTCPSSSQILPPGLPPMKYWARPWSLFGLKRILKWHLVTERLISAWNLSCLSRFTLMFHSLSGVKTDFSFQSTFWAPLSWTTQWISRYAVDGWSLVASLLCAPRTSARSRCCITPRPVLQLDQMCCGLGFRTLQSWQLSSELYSRHRLLGKGRVSCMNLIAKLSLAWDIFHMLVLLTASSPTVQDPCCCWISALMLYPSTSVITVSFLFFPEAFEQILRAVLHPRLFSANNLKVGIYLFVEREQSILEKQSLIGTRGWFVYRTCIKLKRGPSVWGRLDGRPWLST